MNEDHLFPPHRLGLNTDLYELTMMASYLDHDMTFEATFELFYRRPPKDRGFVVAAGLPEAVEYVTELSFQPDEIDYLRDTEPFTEVDDSFFEYLNDFSFSGTVNAAREGDIVFPGEPFLQVTAPLPEAQVLETALLSIVNYQSLITTKAARICQEAGDRRVVDFGMRRAHGPWAALWAAKACYLGGCDGTSNLLAGRTYDIPVFGTAAHSFTMANPSEKEAFRRYHETFPNNTILLIDTYSIDEGAKNALEFGEDVRAVRIDSGDLIEETRKVRRMLDDAGMEETKIILSGGLDEYRLRDLLAGDPPVDSFGVGSRMVTSSDDPYLDVVYKLVEECSGGTPRPQMKTSEGKRTVPGKKQVYRLTDESGQYREDRLCYHTEDASGDPLLTPAIRDGERVRDPASLEERRERLKEQLRKVPEPVRRIRDPDSYPVKRSDRLKEITKKCEERIAGGG